MDMLWSTSARFPIIAFVVAGAIWVAPVLHTLFAFGLICLAACLVMAAVVFDRSSDLSPVISDPATDYEGAPGGVRRALIIGAGTVGQTLAEHLEADGRYHVVGFVDDSLIPIDRNYPPVLGGRDMTPALVRQYGIDE